MRRIGSAPLAGTAILALAACHAPAVQSPHAFAVDVVLTPAAAARLQALHEKVSVIAAYSGRPAPGVQATPDGQVDLGSETVELSPTQSHAAFMGTVVDGSELKTIEGPPRVLINVVSARHAAPDNLLDCNIFEDDIAVAQAKTPRITCDLIKG